MHALKYLMLLYCYLLPCFFKAIRSTSPSVGQEEAWPHPLHVSTTSINYNAKDSQLEITCTIFTDDFEAALAKQYNAKTDLTKPALHAVMDGLVKNYMSSHVKIKTGSNPAALSYLGYEIDREAVNVYLEADKVPPFKKAMADISLLHNLYDDQINIVHITENGNRKSAKLEYPETRVTQEF